MNDLICGCGNMAVVQNNANAYSFKYNPLFWVTCKKCKINTMFYPTEDEAITAFRKATRADIKQGIIETLVKLGYLKHSKIMPLQKPTHGNCCTCQQCGYSHDDCVCNDNELLAEINLSEKSKEQTE